ncbi:hypothetical protein F5X96DRAFT_637342 [Biscogniauxia mediterranea]|nr:hypothetical protein F5X96DRAFT_637342 [Biscogniauxia mediterranea]
MKATILLQSLWLYPVFHSISSIKSRNHSVHTRTHAEGGRMAYKMTSSPTLIVSPAQASVISIVLHWRFTLVYIYDTGEVHDFLLLQPEATVSS